MSENGEIYTAGSDGRDQSHLRIYDISLTLEGLEEGFFRIDTIDRLAGTLFGGQGVFYQNDEGVRSEKETSYIIFFLCRSGQYLTPDATSNPTTLHWIVSEAPGAFNGGVR